MHLCFSALQNLQPYAQLRKGRWLYVSKTKKCHHNEHIQSADDKHVTGTHPFSLWRQELTFLQRWLCQTDISLVSFQMVAPQPFIP